MSGQPYKYWAFISYSHQDQSWANWLHKSLETYRVPRRLVGREHWSGPLPRRLMPIFRDRDELPSSAELGSVLNEALQQSRYLIVICSPQSARSRWVNEEVKYFKSLGRTHRVLPLIISGEPNASEFPNSGLVECLPPAIRFEVDDAGEVTKRKAEPIAADARGGKDGRATAKLKLIAGLIGVGLDELRQRERQRQIQRRLFAATASIALTLLTGLAWHWQQNEKQRALEAQALRVRIDQLYENGREELLAHNEARAAVYLNKVYELGVDTPALRYMLARAMRPVDAQMSRVKIGAPAILVSLNPVATQFLAVDKGYRLGIWNAKSGEKLSSYDLGSTTQLVSAEFSPKGSLIYAATDHSDSPENRLRILDARSGRLLAQFRLGHVRTDVTLMPIDDADREIAYLKEDYSIAVFSLKDKKERRIAGRYSSVRFCRDQRSIIAGTSEGAVYLLDRRTKNVLRKFTGLRGAVTALDSSRECKTLSAATSEGAVRVWDVASGEVLMTAGHATAISDLRLNYDGSRLMSLTRNGVNVWNGLTGALLYAGKFFDPLSNLAAMSPDGERLASVENEHLVLIRPASGTRLFSLDGHQGSVRNFSFGASAQKLISSGPDGSVVIWNLPADAGTEIRFGPVTDRGMLSLPQPPEAQAHFSHSGSTIVAGGGDGDGILLRSDTFKESARLTGQRSPVSVMAMTADDKIVAISDWAQALRLWDISSGRMIGHLAGLGADAIALSFDPLNRFLSASILGRGTTFLSIPDGNPIQHFDTGLSRAQKIDRKGEAYAFGVDGTVKSWDLARKKFLWSRLLTVDKGSGETITVVDYSLDSKKILVVLERRRAFILDSATGKTLQQMDEPAAAGLYTAAFSPDGNSVILGDNGKTVFLWRLDSNAVMKLIGHSADIRAAAFSPEGALLVSGGGDGALKFWDAIRGELLDSIDAHDGAISWDGVQFSPNGIQLISSGTDNATRVWNVKRESRNPDQIAALLRCHVAWRVSDSTLVSSPTGSQGCAKSPSVLTRGL